MYLVDVALTPSLASGNIQQIIDPGKIMKITILLNSYFLFREIVCSSYKFNKEMIGYDLRRNESISYDYNNMFAPNMYSKVIKVFKRFNIIVL